MRFSWPLMANSLVFAKARHSARSARSSASVATNARPPPRSAAVAIGNQFSPSSSSHASRGSTVAAREFGLASDVIHQAADDLVRNPTEALMLQALLLSLPAIPASADVTVGAGTGSEVGA